MISKFFSIFFYIGLCSAAGYAPKIHTCPTKVHVVQKDVEVTASQIQVVTDGPYYDIDLYVNGFTTTSVVMATKVVLSTETSFMEPVTHTEVKVDLRRVPLTQTEVRTITSLLTSTDINVVTVTATNYETSFATRTATSTKYDETVLISRATTELTKTTTSLVVSTYVRTEAPLRTTEITTQVPHTRIAYVTVKRPTNKITRTFTDVVTRTVCPRTERW